MFRLIMQVVVLFLLHPILCSAQDGSDDSFFNTTPLGLSVSGNINRMSGDTRYRLDTTTNNPFVAGEIVDLSSELVFPLDVGLVEISLCWRPRIGGTDSWAVAAGFSTNTSNPSLAMTNRDWLDHVEISSTVSPSELMLRQASFSVGRMVLSSRSFRASIIAELNWMQVDHTIIGYTGWYDFGGNGERFAVSGTEHVSDYTLSSLSPTLGAETKTRLGEFLEVSVAGGAGLAILRDHDDHLVRSRISEGEATGLGLHASAGIHFIDSSKNPCPILFGVIGDFRYFHGEGSQTQRWYEREGSIEAGTEVSGIPLTFDGIFYRIGVEAGFTF